MKRARWISLVALCFLQACTPAVRSGAQAEALPGRADAHLTFIDGDDRTFDDIAADRKATRDE